MDVLRKEVLHTFNLHQGTNPIDVSGLERGVYLLKFILKDRYLVEKVIIQ